MIEKFRNEADVLLIPGAYKSGKIYGMNAKNGEIVPFTFTRAGAATYFDKNGVMQSAAAGMPRIDYDPLTKVCQGYLLEKSATNYLPYSGTFSRWSATRSIIEDLKLAVDGTLTAAKLVAGAEMGAHYANYQLTAAGVRTYSIYVKPQEIKRVSISFGSNSVNGSASFDLENGTVYAAPPADYKCDIVAASDGWFKISISNLVAIVGVGFCRLILYDVGGATTNYSGDGVSGVLFCCAQIEDGGVATSYIPTNGSQVTRPTDYLASQTDLVNDTESSVFGQLSSYGQGINTVYYNRQNAGASGILYLSTDVRTYDSTISVTSATNLAQIKAGKLFKALSSWGNNGLALSIDGEYKRSTAPYDGTMGTPGNMIIRNPATPRMYLKSFAVFNRQLSPLEHQEITEFTDETNAVLSYARANNYELPSKAYIIKLENHIKALQVAGVWHKLDVAYFMAGDGDMNFKTINILNPYKFKGSVIGGITNSNSGLKGNGLDGYIDTNFNPATSGVKYTLNNASYGMWVSQSLPNYILHGVANSTRQLMQNSVSNSHQINSSSSGITGGNGIFDGTGLKAIHRDDASNLRLYSDSTEALRTQPSSTNEYGGNLLLLRRTSAYGSAGIASYFAGGALTAAENEAYRLSVLNNL